MGHRVSYAAALGAAVVLLLSGCSDEPEPKFADPTSEVPTSTGVEPVTEPPTSEPTEVPKPEGAQAFIRRWHQVSDAMQVSGETKDYRQLGPDCESCVRTADLVESYYVAGGFIRYAGTDVQSIKKVSSNGDVLEFEVTRNSPPTRFQESASAPTMTIDGGKSMLRMKIRREGAAWVVVDYSQAAS